MKLMPFVPGDLVHVAALGKGVVREVRNAQRYLVEVKGRSLVTTENQLTLREERPSKSSVARIAPASRKTPEYEGTHAHPSSLDLHGHTVAEALDALSAFLNLALLSGSPEVRIIHGRSGGKIRAALHAQLKQLRSVRNFRVDPRNTGVTIIEL